jgi:hypothetical protein
MWYNLSIDTNKEVYMSQRGSFINHMAANSKHVFNMPQVGDGVTFYSWTDRHAGTVVSIVDENKLIIEIKHDTVKRVDSNGMSDCQLYEYERNDKAPSQFYKWDAKKSQWIGVEQSDKGRWILKSNMTISIGKRSAYHDFSF